MSSATFSIRFQAGKKIELTHYSFSREKSEIEIHSLKKRVSSQNSPSSKKDLHILKVFKYCALLSRELSKHLDQHHYIQFHGLILGC